MTTPSTQMKLQALPVTPSVHLWGGVALTAAQTLVVNYDHFAALRTDGVPRVDFTVDAGTALVTGWVKVVDITTATVTFQIFATCEGLALSRLDLWQLTQHIINTLKENNLYETRVGETSAIAQYRVSRTVFA